MTQRCEVCNKPMYHGGWALLRIDRDGDPVRDEVDCCSRECVREALTKRGKGE